MNPKSLAPAFAGSAQLTPTDIDPLRALGFRAIIVNRPDGEEAGQPSIDEMQAVASAAGMEFAAIAMAPGKVTDAGAAQFEEALRTREGPAIA